MTTKYFKMYKGTQFAPTEVTKEVARQTLDGYWKKEELDRIFDNEIAFRLFTPYAEVWTKQITEDGHEEVPMAGLYGTCE